MKISYNWLQTYLPITLSLQECSTILTSIGLEVEGIEHFESIQGSLKGLVIGEVLDVQPHPNADKLKITQVHTGAEKPLQIVCGASNVAVGQKVVVAIVGTTIHPIQAAPITMKIAKIRGVESYGMICAEDEIGISTNHDGIIVLPNDCIPGTSAANHFQPYEDNVLEIGLTPNRMDAMSHWGVAKDICAYLTHHKKSIHAVKYPYSNAFTAATATLPINVQIQHTTACKRYSAISLTGITVQPSPQWIINRLLAIGVRSINNIVDISNYILHETGQPLHIFDADAIQGNTIIVRNADTNSSFITLDGKERKLHAEDLMICNATEPMAIAGVFGGQHSGVTANTKNIFIESAWFNPINIRKTSMRNGLRTDAATRFEKGVDISKTVQALKRATLLIQEIAGGKIASNIIDEYPEPIAKKEITLSFHYLKKLTGKNYHPDAVQNILKALDFEIIKENIDSISVTAPYSKPDISLPADVVEEIIRIDGLDNITIPTKITITPAIDEHKKKNTLKEKLANYLVGNGFREIITNSITNSNYYTPAVLENSVRLLNNLSVMLDIMRPSMLETGLEVIAYNLNRKNEDLLLFELGKTYSKEKDNTYKEEEHFILYVTGAAQALTWHSKAKVVDLFWIKGLANNLLELLGIQNITWEKTDHASFEQAIQCTLNKKNILLLGEVKPSVNNHFDIRQPVWIIDINWNALLDYITKKKDIQYTEVSKFPFVERDLAIVLPKNISYQQIEQIISASNTHKLQSTKVFDVFEHEKLGNDKRSIALRFIFKDEEKTLTDEVVEKMMHKITQALEKNIQAEVRK